MTGLEPADFFTDRDRVAITQQLKLREAGSRNIAAYLRALRNEYSSHENNDENRSVLAKLDQGIKNAEVEAEKTRQEIESWGG